MQERAWTWEEDGCTVVRTNARTGPGCHINCGVLQYVKDGKLVKVEGDPENPFNQGRLCARCLSIKDVVYHEKRLQYPMVRVGERGENKWKRVSWDEAYDLIEEKFNAIKKECGPQSVAFIQGTGRDIFQLSRLAYAFGSPNEGGGMFSGNSCYLPRIAAMGCMTGESQVMDCSQFFTDRYDNPEYRIPETVLIWGHNPFPSNSDGFFGHWVTDLMERGSRIIVIDLRLTWIATRAEQWLQLRPGTDGALAMGMLHVIIKENLYDQQFVEKWIHGFDELKERVADWTPERVAEITWLTVDEILKVSRTYAQSKPAAIQWGVAIDQTNGGTEASQAMISLWSITGNIDVPGGNVIGRPCWGITEPNWTGGWGYHDFLTEEQKSMRFGIREYPLHNFGFLVHHPDTLTKAIETGEPYAVKGIWAQTNNLLGCMTVQPEKYYKIIKDTVDFIVIVDLFPNPATLGLADVVLPAATFAEKKGYSGLNPYYIGAITPGIEPVGECRPDQQIILDMGKRFNPEAFPWKDLEEMADFCLEQAGFTWNELKEKTWMYPEFAYHKAEKALLRADGEPGFNTPTGKIEVYCTIFEHIGLDPLPNYIEPAESPLLNPEAAQKYPLILTTGARQQAYFHSEGRQVKRWRRMHPDPIVEIHPEVAAEQNIHDGDWVYIENQYGKCKMKAQITKTLDPRVVHADHGWWFPERDPEDGTLYGAFESQINNLMDFKCGKSGFGACYKCMICKVYKVEGSGK